MSPSPETTSLLHAVTLTPFFPSDQNEVDGCFIAEPVAQLRTFGIDSTVIAASPIYYPRRRQNPAAPANWIRFPRVPGNLGLSSAGYFLYARLLPEILKLHREKPISVIHAHAALPCGHAAALLCRSLNIPFVVTVHGLDVFNTCFLDGIPAAWRRNESMNVYRAAGTVICVSGKVQEVLKAGMSPVPASTILHNGVDPNLFSPGPAQGNADLEILVVGTLIPSKGHELVLKALANLKPAFPRLRCRIIGDGPYRPQLEALASQLGVTERARFVGRQTRAEVARAMRGCSVFALPSSNEGLGCVYLEAMACGKPVIGCSGQGIAEVIEDGKNGFLVPPDGLNQLVQVLSALLESKDMCDRIGEAARQTILEKFTLSHQAQQLADIYREAVR